MDNHCGGPDAKARMYEGRVWRIDFSASPTEHHSIMVLANTMEQAQALARPHLQGMQVIGFYAVSGVRGAVYEGGK